jgi:hypothetical protein
MPNLHLTELSVRALRGSESYATYWDTATPGFGLRVGKRSKTWTVMRGRSRERVTIGRYPDLPLSKARTEAKRFLSTEPEAKVVTIPFTKARDEFLEDNYRFSKGRTKYVVTGVLKRHFKNLGTFTLAEIEDAHVQGCLDKLADRPSAQLHAYRYLRTFFRWCVRPPRRYLKHSPMEGYEPPGQDRKGTRVLSDKELKAVWEASNCPRTVIFRLMVLWGTRNSETCLLEREWTSQGVITIPGASTKNGRDHSVPLLPLAESVLTQALGNNQFYFAGREGHGHLTAAALPKLKRQVMEASGTSRWQIRDLRRTFRSNMARLKVPREVCEVLINHAPSVLDEIYDRYDRLPEKREALAKYEAFVQSLIA